MANRTGSLVSVDGGYCVSIIKVNNIKVIHLAGVLSRPFSYGLVYVSTTGLTAGIGSKSSLRFFSRCSAS